MTRLRLIPLSLFDRNRPADGARPADRRMAPFRRTAARAGPAGPGPQAQPAQPDVILDQDPTQPVARVDGYGQPEQPQQHRTAATAANPAACRSPALRTAQRGAIKPGTFVTVRTEQGLSSDHNQAGDFFSASLAQPIVVDGIVVAQTRTARDGPGGRSQEGRTRVEGTSRLALQLTGLTLVDGTQANIQSQLVQRNGQTSVGSDVAAVATTTAMGAAIGAAADWGRGAAIGAGAGAAAGLVGVLLTRGTAHRGLPGIAADVPPRLAGERGPDPCPAGVPLCGSGRIRPPGADHHGAPRADAGRPVLRSFVWSWLWSWPLCLSELLGPSPYGWGYPYAWGPSFGVGVVFAVEAGAGAAAAGGRTLARVGA